MPKGKHPRTPEILANMQRGRKAMWAKRTKEQRRAIMSKIAKMRVYKKKIIL